MAVTSATRLLFTATEALLLRYGATHAYCDAWFNGNSSTIYKRDTKLLWRLNSYDFDADIFKLEKSNVWFYGIFYKIHVLYDYGDKCTIHKFTLHGL